MITINSVLKNRIKDNPFIFSIIILIPIILSSTAGNGVSQDEYYLIRMIIRLTISLLLIFMLKWLDIIDTSGLNSLTGLKKIWLLYPIFIFMVINGLDFFTGELDFNASPKRLILFFGYYISVGILEEFVCRSTMLNLMLIKWGDTRKGIYKAVFASSLLFGLAHITNFIFGRADIGSSLTQILYAVFFGVFFAACMIRTKSIFPCIIAHTLVDIFGNLDDLSTISNFGSTRSFSLDGALLIIAVTCPLFLYGLFLLRKSKI